MAIKEIKGLLRPDTKLRITKDRIDRDNIGKEFIVLTAGSKYFTFGYYDKEGIPVIVDTFYWRGALYEDGYLYQFDIEENVERGFIVLW